MINERTRSMNKNVIVSMVLATVGGVAFCDAADERLRELEKICAYEPCDDLDVKEAIPTPDDIIRKYNVTTNVVVQDLWTLTARYSPSETNEEKKVIRDVAVMFIGHYGGTNDLAQLSTIATNSSDYAQESALFASLAILEHSPQLISFVRGVVTNACSYSSGLRGSTYVRLLDMCTERYTDMYINDPAQQARIAAFFLERAAVDVERPLSVDDCACELNPTYRHSKQRRDNLAALRPPNLTGKPAELYDAAQADAAKED